MSGVHLHQKWQASYHNTVLYEVKQGHMQDLPSQVLKGLRL